MTKQKSLKTVVSRPPIVTILGHVDHGKTTLLDTIRKTNIAEKEYGGITQHIGAYQVTVYPEGKSSSPRKITFIDTPGHEAFAKMRSRGTDACDIAILVVAGNDGVMPQTVESYAYIQKARIPCIVAINKIDLPGLNKEKIKKQLVKLGLELEEYGGETPIVFLSAKTGEGIDKLLEMILFLADLYQVREDSPGNLKAIVIESILSKNRGPVASVILRSGKLLVGDEVICEDQEFRVRALTNWLGQNQNSASSSDPVEVLGWKNVPVVGSILYNKQQVELIKPVEKELTLPKALQIEVAPVVLPGEQEKIKLIIKADTTGTLEAVLGALKTNPNIMIVGSGVGEIIESDIFLGKTTNALVVGFHQKLSDSVAKLAESEKVIVKTYNIIYELIKEIDDVISAIRQGNLVKILGEAKVIAIFPFNDQKVAGVKVTKGRIARGDQVKIVRSEKELGRARIKSLRHGKEDINSTSTGSEAGLILSQDIDILTGDSIISIG
jgi:translation initiation factor IF-2